MSTRTPAATPAAPTGDIESACVLVVDDQPANIQIVGRVLGGQGCEIIPAADGPTALKRVSLRKPDLILLDLLMPGMDGCEVCRQLKRNPDWKDIPVIFLSAADDKDLIVRALNAGGADYITKPFNHAELVSRARTHLTLKTTRDRLRQIAEDKDELIGILAHDLKNSLGGMNMSAELLHAQIARLNNERLARLSENILRTNVQSLVFLKEYLANSAADHGLALKPGAANLSEIAAATNALHQENARRKGIAIEADLANGAVMARADASALGQVLDNLISNALKFSPPGKRIFVSVRATDKHAECVVRDEGPGFTAEDKTRMFRRYGRLSARPTGGELSTGLGLSIVHKLVLAMGGELQCESTPGNGAEFTIRLPRHG